MFGVDHEVSGGMREYVGVRGRASTFGLEPSCSDWCLGGVGCLPYKLDKYVRVSVEACVLAK